MSLDMDDVLEDIFKYHWTSLDIEDPLNDTLKDILNDIFKYVSALSNIKDLFKEVLKSVTILE